MSNEFLAQNLEKELRELDITKLKDVYRLPDNLIISKRGEEAGIDYFLWVQWLIGTYGELYRLAGLAWIKKGVLLLQRSKVHTVAEFEDIDTIQAYLRAFPKWDKTKYFLLEYNATGKFSLWDVRTGQELSKEMYKKIMLKLDYIVVDEEHNIYK